MRKSQTMQLVRDWVVVTGMGLKYLTSMVFPIVIVLSSILECIQVTTTIHGVYPGFISGFGILMADSTGMQESVEELVHGAGTRITQRTMMASSLRLPEISV